jgi:hypothetical protein
MSERENGWLQEVLKTANERVEKWPEWKKASEARRSENGAQELRSAQPDGDEPKNE